MRRRLLVSGLLLSAACIQDRERLEPPRVSLALADQTVQAGGDVFGTISAADASGIIYVSAQIRIEGDSLSPRRSFANPPESDTIQYSFRLTVRPGFPAGTPIYVTATVIDDQNFEVVKEDTISIR